MEQPNFHTNEPASGLEPLFARKQLTKNTGATKYEYERKVKCRTRVKKHAWHQQISTKMATKKRANARNSSNQYQPIWVNAKSQSAKLLLAPHTGPEKNTGFPNSTTQKNTYLRSSSAVAPTATHNWHACRIFLHRVWVQLRSNIRTYSVNPFITYTRMHANIISQGGKTKFNSPFSGSWKTKPLQKKHEGIFNLWTFTHMHACMQRCIQWQNIPIFCVEHVFRAKNRHQRFSRPTVDKNSKCMRTKSKSNTIKMHAE